LTWIILLIAGSLGGFKIGRIEGLDKDVENSLGELLHAEPWYGYGWTRLDHAGPRTSPEPPDPFELRFIRFTIFSSRGRRRGGIGKIEHPGHELDGFWAAFVPRYAGSFNFTDHLVPCNTVIGPEEPAETEEVWEAMQHGEPRLAGWCEIRVLSREGKGMVDTVEP
ncbi:MAG: hypothetical protein KC978_14390, partial [Candidatus Omnitrophica bacterium]|nr:hypothetical protein [Candidatus Omnitrophota bacterium]